MIDIHLKANPVVLPHQIELSPLSCAVKIEDEICVPRVTEVHGNDIGCIIYGKGNPTDIRLADNVFKIDGLFNLSVFPSQD
jgi:hypothetical protein